MDVAIRVETCFSRDFGARDSQVGCSPNLRVPENHGKPLNDQNNWMFDPRHKKKVAMVETC